MQFGRLYTTVTKLPKEDEALPEREEDAGRVQLRQNWIQSTITQELRKTLELEIGHYIDQAVKLSCIATSNREQIVQLLVRVDTLNKQLERYATGK